MPSVDLLQQRLDSIAQALQASGQALALLGLGSVGRETSRLDRYSDLDFFAIVKPGQKARFIDNLDWLTCCGKPGFYFRNTVDGYKFLYEDGVFCEFAVFELAELAAIPFAEGRIIWADASLDPADLLPRSQAGQYRRSPDQDWILGEALTNLYVGLCRHNRGEKLSGMKFVQSFALDRLVDLIQMKQAPADPLVDNYMPDRRLESRYPGTESLLEHFCQGYRHTPASALAQLAWLEQHFSVNAAIAGQIRALAQESLGG